MDHFQVLGVTPSASALEIKAAYHAKARKFHPDRATMSSSTPDETFVQIQQAWECLNDETRRQKYQQQLHLQKSRLTQRYSSAIPLQMEDCTREEIEKDEMGLLYTCRCGCTLEVTPLDPEEEENGPEDEEHPPHIVECPDCSLLYNTSALALSTK